MSGLIALSVLMFSCSAPRAEEEADGEVLVAVGDSVLTVSDVLTRIPAGLAESDSAALFGKIVDEWVRELVLADFARKNISDIDRIDRLVETYRNNLIVTSYLQSMADNSAVDVSEKRIRQYFEVNKENMILEEPILKGAFLKVSEADRDLDKLRGWMADFSDSSIDRIEEAGLRHASTYKYFKDQWVSWSEIAHQIPYRFFDADAFVRSSANFETSDAGSVYLLHISDYKTSGEEMPYDYARVRIREILTAADLAKQREKLISDIYTSQIKDGILKPGAYDPVNHKFNSSY